MSMSVIKENKNINSSVIVIIKLFTSRYNCMTSVFFFQAPFKATLFSLMFNISSNAFRIDVLRKTYFFIFYRWLDDRHSIWSCFSHSADCLLYFCMQSMGCGVQVSSYFSFLRFFYGSQFSLPT